MVAKFLAVPAPCITRSCPVCGDATDQELVYEKWGYPIRRCRRCGLGATEVDEQFEPATLYGADYFHSGRRDGYANYAGSERVLRAEFRRSVAALRAAGAVGGHLLELGCAYGFFLQEAQPWFQCTGIEVCADAVESCRARGLDVHPGVLTRDFLRERPPFDAAVLLDVIEHLEDPAETLTLLAEGLTPGGHVLITTGDWDSLLSRALGRRWRLMTPPQHLFFFSRRTLPALLQRLGFAMVQCVRPWKVVPLGLIAYQLGNRLGCRLRFLESVNRLGVPLNLFDTMRIIARKMRS